jgi:protease secretion system membrane fusion protein
VKADDVLIVLDDNASKAAYQGIRQNYLSQRALESRLLAEVSGAGDISFHPTCSVPTTPWPSSTCWCSEQLFAARRGAHAAELAALEFSIAGTESQHRRPAADAPEPQGASRRCSLNSWQA